jgi:hypothetical protein
LLIFNHSAKGYVLRGQGQMLIVQMALAGVGQPQIRKIVGGGMGEINGIAKLVRPKKLAGKKNGGDK